MRTAHGNSSRLQGRWTGFLIGAGPDRARRRADRGGMDPREETIRSGLAVLAHRVLERGRVDTESPRRFCHPSHTIARHDPRDECPGHPDSRPIDRLAR